jgi:diguanylate cyclase (GGDEF)-like protein
MRLFARRDALLLVGLTAALLIIFAAPISRLLDTIRDVERTSGLTLLPALVVLTVVYVFHELRKRHEIQAQAAAAHAATREAERRTVELERLVAFGHGLARALDDPAIAAAVMQHLPRVAGTEDLWVLVLRGEKWDCLVGDARVPAEVLQRETFADRLLSGSARTDEGSTIGFPLVVGGMAVGALGVNLGGGTIDPDRHRAIEAAAALLAVSLKNAQLFNEVRENSWRDALTGCVTRTYAAEVIDAELRRARRSRNPVSVIMFDLDHFKTVNDRYGHLCGDAVLASVGQRMRDVLRGSDLKCRWGGEEFLVLLPETPIQGACRVAETLRRELADRSITWAREVINVTASFGVTQVLPGEINVDAIVGRADAALYRAKESGRNSVHAATETVAPVEVEERAAAAPEPAPSVVTRARDRAFPG